jgi:hypothetical protein
MEPLRKLELKLADVLDKKAPVRLSAAARAYLANVLWVLALVFGVLQLWVLFDRLALRMLDGTYTDGYVEPDLGFFYYLSLTVLMVAAVLMLAAAPGLRALKKEGWNLLFYAVLANVLYGVLRLFAGAGGFGAMVWTLLLSAIAAYFAFQARGQFKAASKKSSGNHKAGSEQ